MLDRRNTPVQSDPVPCQIENIALPQPGGQGEQVHFTLMRRQFAKQLLGLLFGDPANSDLAPFALGLERGHIVEPFPLAHRPAEDGADQRHIEVLGAIRGLEMLRNEPVDEAPVDLAEDLTPKMTSEPADPLHIVPIGLLCAFSFSHRGAASSHKHFGFCFSLIKSHS